MLRLPDLQRALLRAIATGEDAGEPPDETAAVVAEIRDRPPLDAWARVRIYARMYGARLVDALAEDFPRVAAVLGADRFRDLARAYVAACPSRHPSLRWLGARFPEFLAANATSNQPKFLPDLARLEWARVMVFDATDVALLSLEELRRRPPDVWVEMRLRCVPALEILRVAWPVHEIWDVVGGADAGWPTWGRGDLRLRIWRQGDRVYQTPMDPVEGAALDQLMRGDTFGTLCEGLARLLPAEEVAAVAGGLVLRWIEDEVLRADDAPP